MLRPIPIFRKGQTIERVITLGNSTTYYHGQFDPVTGFTTTSYLNGAIPFEDYFNDELPPGFGSIDANPSFRIGAIYTWLILGTSLYRNVLRFKSNKSTPINIVADGTLSFVMTYLGGSYYGDPAEGVDAYRDYYFIPPLVSPGVSDTAYKLFNAEISRTIRITQ